MTDCFMEDERVQQIYGCEENTEFDEFFKKVSIESLLFYVVASVIWIREKARQMWLEDVERTALATRYGTKQWWHEQSLKWQKGDHVEVLSDGTVGYTVEDADKKIVKYAAISEEGRTVYVKVAKESNGELHALDEEELQMFKEYINKIKPVGILVNAQSSRGCRLQINGKIYYNGENSGSVILQDVYVYVRKYLSEIEFGGVLYKNKIIDAVQVVAGVCDAEISIRVKDAGIEDWVYMNRSYKATGGFYVVDAWGLSAVEEINSN